MSEHRGVSVQDRRVAPTQPRERMSHRASGPPPQGPPPGGRRAAKGGNGGPNRMRVMAWVSIGLTVALVGALLTGYGMLRSTFSGLRTEDVASKIKGPRPQNLTGALNVLIVGSDTRAGKGNARYGQKQAREVDAGGKRTDTMLLMHISPNRDTAQIVSLPRDSMVLIPECQNEKTGATIPAHTYMINSAYNSGGIACTIKTVESLTGIRIDHFVEVDFSGFKNIVDALGGVEMCFTTAINEPLSKFNITAGTHKLNGEQALAYMRLRKIGADQSDLQRIKRQQKFLSKMVQAATSTNLMTDVGKLTKLIDAAKESVLMDEDLAKDPQKLLDIAASAGKLTASGVKFIMVPVEAYPADKNRVQWVKREADLLWQQIAQDVEVVQQATAKPTGPQLKPQQVQIQVLNGTDRVGEAQKVADELTKWGFKVVGVGNTPAAAPQTKVLYSAKSAADKPFAELAAAKLSGTKPAAATKVKPVNLKPYTPSAGVSAPEFEGKVEPGPIVQVVIGADYQGVRVPTTVSKVVEQNTVTADQKNICT
ncbi:LCP family protein [Nonomuraea sp. NPDC050310]|uniref:LCP family protein n=1 Tax=Nonomuraea sp. NPDC050310 TaxID=3154935 RepID=UPI00340B9232